MFKAEDFKRLIQKIKKERKRIVKDGICSKTQLENYAFWVKKGLTTKTSFIIEMLNFVMMMTN